MADEKELNPSPAVVHGEYPELSPNPNFTGENEKGSDQAENMHPSVSGERPQVFKDVVMNLLKVKKDIYIRGKKIEDYIDSQGGVTEEEMEEYVESVLGGKIKYAYFIYDEEKNEFVNVGEELPEDFTGISLFFGDDGLYIEYWDNGNLEQDLSLSPGQITVWNEHNGDNASLLASGVEIGEGNEVVTYSINGASKINFASLTHSFNELDETLKQIVEDAIADAETDGVACTQAQWNVIKALLDNSLYLNYDGFSFIKTVTNGIDSYVFGAMSKTDVGSSLTFYYDSENANLQASHYEI